MGLAKVFDVAGSAMNAQSVRLNVTASNLANADSVHGDPSKVYRSRSPVFTSFSEVFDERVRIEGIVENPRPLAMQYRPDHPDANADGNVFVSNVNTVEEMVNMLSASRAYQNSVELLGTTKELMLQTLSLGR